MGHCGRPDLASVGPDLVTPALAALATLMARSGTTPPGPDAETTSIRRDCRSTSTESPSALRNQRRYPWWTEGSVVHSQVPDRAVRTEAGVERSDVNVP